MRYRFNTPPGWPTPPADWTPDARWTPDPSWPPAPDGWRWWVPCEQPAPTDASAPSSAEVTAELPILVSPAISLDDDTIGSTTLDNIVPPGGEPAPRPVPAHEGRTRPPRSLSWSVHRGSPASTPDDGDPADAGCPPEETAAEQVRLAREELDDVAGQIEIARAALAQAQGELVELRKAIVLTEDTVHLQRVGYYEFRHPARDAVEYRRRLADLREGASELIADERALAVTADPPARHLDHLPTDLPDLLLHAYNAEADNCVRTVSPDVVDAVVRRLERARVAFSRVGALAGVEIGEEYHRLRVREIELTADYVAASARERDRVRAARERRRHDDAARRDAEREQARLRERKSRVTAELTRLMADGDEAGVDRARACLEELNVALEHVRRRDANPRAGYVYVLSNVGAFGGDVVKIGMTRRLDPLDHVHELAGGSVPFPFDVHALVFCDDAAAVVAALHHALADARLNPADTGGEFFRTAPANVRDLLVRFAGAHLVEFHDLPRGSGELAGHADETDGAASAAEVTVAVPG